VRLKVETFVESANSRQVLGAFLKGAKTQLLIYDPKISDKEMLRILQDRARAGVEIKVIGQVSGRNSFEARRLSGTRLHTRTIIRDRRRAFIGSQSLRRRTGSRREVGLIVQDATSVKQPSRRSRPTGPSRAAGRGEGFRRRGRERRGTGCSNLETSREGGRLHGSALASTVKKAVRQAVVKAGQDVLHDTDVKDTMKKVVKKAVKAAVKEAVHEAQAAAPETA
jgi:hypothetical protein